MRKKHLMVFGFSLLTITFLSSLAVFFIYIQPVVKIYGLNFKDFKSDYHIVEANRSYIANLRAVTTDPIHKDSADLYHSLYWANKQALTDRFHVGTSDSLGMDTTKAIIFELDSIMDGAVEAFNFSSSTFNLNDFENKAFLAYFANYGNKYRLLDTNLYQNTLIIQFASRKSETDEWEIAKDIMYNFGDMRPPHPVRGEQIDGIIGN